MDTRKRRSIRILMFPWLAYGHVSPFLQLAKSLARRNFIFYIASSQINLASIRGKLSEKDSVSIKLVDLHVPTSPDLPSHYHTTSGLPPHLMPALKEAMDFSRPHISTLLKTLKPDLVVYDFLHPSVPEEAAGHDIPAVLFLSPGAAATSYFIHHCFENPTSEYPFPGVSLRESECPKSTGIKASDFERLRECVTRSFQIVLIKSFKEIEGKYIDYLSFITGKKFVPVGTLFQYPETMESHENDEFIKWLDGKSEGSTVFASFGSEYFLKESQVEEIALGLEKSGANFILVLRSPQGQGSKIQEMLPEGFFDRVGERGMVVEGWAPQARILSHPSVGGFLSHCGWSSVMEGIHCSVPIIAVPIHLDQPLNARLVEEVGIGEVVARDGEGKIEGGEIARVIREVMMKKSGQSLKLRMRELSEKVKEKGEEEVDAAAEELVRLCGRSDGMMDPSNPTRGDGFFIYETDHVNQTVLRSF